MTPTNKLRFVERTTMRPYERAVDVFVPITIRVLQQWWQPTVNFGLGDESIKGGEWRDVPLEEEK